MEVRLAAFVPREGRLLQQGDSWARQLLDVLQSPRVGEAGGKLRVFLVGRLGTVPCHTIRKQCPLGTLQLFSMLWHWCDRKANDSR